MQHLRAWLGLNTGPAIIGKRGSRTRFSYTMMGDNVNLASRMESGGKLLGVCTMVTESTKTECEKHGNGDRFVFRYLDKIVVQGRCQPLAVYEIVGFKEHISPRTFDCLGSTHRASSAILRRAGPAPRRCSRKARSLSRTSRIKRPAS